MEIKQKKFNRVGTCNTLDDLLEGFSYQELIDTAYCNEVVINEAVIRKVFKELINIKVKDAEAMLNVYMDDIIRKIKA